MLRTIKTTHARPVLIPYQFVLDGAGAVTVSQGRNTGTFAVSGASDSIVTPTLTRAFRRTPVVCATAGADIGPGGTAAIGTGLDAQINCGIRGLNGSGAEDAGTLYSAVLGYESNDTKSYFDDSGVGDYVALKAPRPGGRMIGGIVSAAGAVMTGGTQYTVVLTDTNTFTITFDRPFAEPPTVLASCAEFLAGTAKVTSITNSTAVVETFNASNSAFAIKFHFMVLGFDQRGDSYSDARYAVKMRLRKPRFLAFRVTYSAGTPSIDVGTGDATISDDATGEFTLTYSRAFGVAPTVIATSGNAGTDCFPDVNSGTLNCVIRNSGFSGTISDPEEVMVFVLGTDIAEEF